MNVLGHDDVADQSKFVAVANFSKNLRHDIPELSATEQRQAVITTEGHKVKMIPPMLALETFGHTRENLRHPPLQIKGWGTRKSNAPP